MEAKTLQQIKDEIAIKYGYEDWADLETSLQKKEIGELFEEAAELYAKQIALAACEKQRGICAEKAMLEKRYKQEVVGSVDGHTCNGFQNTYTVDKSSILNAPLAITID